MSQHHADALMAMADSKRKLKQLATQFNGPDPLWEADRQAEIDALEAGANALSPVKHFDHRFREHIQQMSEAIALEAGDVIQIVAGEWTGSFCEVEVVESWGVKVMTPVLFGGKVQYAPMRIEAGHFRRIGIAPVQYRDVK